MDPAYVAEHVAEAAKIAKVTEIEISLTGETPANTALLTTALIRFARDQNWPVSIITLDAHLADPNWPPATVTNGVICDGVLILKSLDISDRMIVRF